MKRRVCSVLAAAAMLTATVGAFGSTAFADQGGVPNSNACFGQATSAAASTGNNPSDRATRFNVSVQQIQKETKAQADAGQIPHCP